MNMQLHGVPSAPRPTAEQRERLQRISGVVASAAYFMIARSWTELPAGDLEALGMLAVWRKLPEYETGRIAFERWAFYIALHAMLDVSRTELRESLLQEALRRGVRAYVVADEEPAEEDFHRDTPQIDRFRITVRTRRLGVAALLEAAWAQADAGTAMDRLSVAAGAVLALREEVAKLPAARRKYIAMRFWDGADAREVAESTGIPERTLRRRWAETRDLLEARLRARGVFGVADGFDDALALLEAKVARDDEDDARAAPAAAARGKERV